MEFPELPRHEEGEHGGTDAEPIPRAGRPPAPREREDPFLGFGGVIHCGYIDHPSNESSRPRMISGAQHSGSKSCPDFSWDARISGTSSLVKNPIFSSEFFQSFVANFHSSVKSQLPCTPSWLLLKALKKPKESWLFTCHPNRLKTAQSPPGTFSSFARTFLFHLLRVALGPPSLCASQTAHRTSHPAPPGDRIFDATGRDRVHVPHVLLRQLTAVILGHWHRGELERCVLRGAGRPGGPAHGSVFQMFFSTTAYRSS